MSHDLTLSRAEQALLDAQPDAWREQLSAADRSLLERRDEVTRDQRESVTRLARTRWARHARFAQAPTASTSEWPGGYVVRDNTLGRWPATPPNALAWRTREEAAQRGEPMWVAFGTAVGGQGVPLDAEYWQGRQANTEAGE